MMSRTILRRAGLLAPLAAVAGILAVSAPAGAATKCGVGTGEGEGYTYLLSLTVTKTNCSTGKSLVRHHGKLSGWHCANKVLNRSQIQYDARMTCTASAGRRVVFEYTQNT
jgi:hypothetical protein